MQPRCVCVCVCVCEREREREMLVISVVLCVVRGVHKSDFRRPVARRLSDDTG